MARGQNFLIRFNIHKHKLFVVIVIEKTSDLDFVVNVFGESSVVPSVQIWNMHPVRPYPYVV